MERQLVVGVDGSQSDIQVVDCAADMAVRHGVPLRVIHASLWEPYEAAMPDFGMGRDVAQVLAENIATSAAERAQRRHGDLKVTAEAFPEDAVTVLLREGHDALAIVTGCRGRGELAGLPLGSVSLAVAVRAHRPVIVVRGAERNRQGAFRRIVLGVGEEPQASAAVRFAFHEADVTGCEIDAVRAWRCPSVETADHPLLSGSAAHVHAAGAHKAPDAALCAPTARYPGLHVQRRTVHGSARAVLLDAAATADLLVVGTRGRHGHVGLHLGPVNHAVLHHAPCPVAVVPQPR